MFSLYHRYGIIIPSAVRCIMPPDGSNMARAEAALLGAVLIVYALAQRLVIRGATAGAIKE